VIVVAGSLNIDLVVRAPRLPSRGETVQNGRFAIFHGGKGANQAVAAARMGAATAMIGRIGDDAFGSRLREGLRVSGVETAGITVTSGTASGVAVIIVDEHGENQIVVAPGANGRLRPEDVIGMLPRFPGAAILLLQLEVPLDTVHAAAAAARAAGMRVLLDPAPAVPLTDELYALVDAIFPNEIEASILTGLEVTGPESAARAARVLRARGPSTVVVKLGARGAWVHLDGRDIHIEGLQAATVDATAAGDVFCGAAAACLDEGDSWAEALTTANAAAALSTTRAGAQESIPTRDEVRRFQAEVASGAGRGPT
jgi:ribokinase